MAPRPRRKKAHDKVLTCYCEGHCRNNLQNGTCETRPGGSCFSAVEEVYDEELGIYEEERTFGCMPGPEDGGLLMCKVSAVPHLHGKNIFCCDDADMCNKNLLPTFRTKTTTPPPVQTAPTQPTNYLVIYASIIGGVCIFIVMIILTYLAYRRREKNREGSENLLSQQTIAKQVQLMEPIGRGQFGEVWIAKWRDEKVAVKVFFSTHEDLYLRETEFYQTVPMRHENILGFIASDINNSGTLPQMLFITDYHEQGSLHNYLKANELSPQMLQELVSSLANGVAYLHAEISGKPKSKPAIAHRNLTSKNVLVKHNGQCAIADFGLSVMDIGEQVLPKKKEKKEKKDQIAENEIVGNPRYMAPEVLNRTLSSEVFEAHKMADIYSMALVFWEMCRRCYTQIPDEKAMICEDYSLPYDDVVSSDPTLEEMQAVVCLRDVRPPIPDRWQDDSILVTLSKLMQECWHSNPTVRLTALRVKKSMMRLEEDFINTG